MDYRQKAKDLIAKAIDVRTPENERAATMVAAVNLIHKHDLLSSPLEGLLPNNETVRAATSIFEHVANPDFVSSVKHLARSFSGRRSGSSRRRR